MSGCEEVQKEPTEKRIEIKAGNDDGGVVVLNSLLPNLTAGFLNGGVGTEEGTILGVITAGENDVTSRALYRFDISEWNNTADMVFHLKCLYRHGNPGMIDIYVVDDFGPLPSVQEADPSDVSDIWNLSESGEKVGSISPSAGEWFEITISKSIIEVKKTSEGYLAFMIKLSDENIQTGNFYTFLNYEYAVSHNEHRPYLTKATL
ncbi:hypothetical protein B6U70_02345 [Euryarchaeota archaeon ex4484_162]|nr:MAG: hypothetical protein B6U70_02345 [Euryarchaeota archaeon ex4484_162]